MFSEHAPRRNEANALNMQINPNNHLIPIWNFSQFNVSHFPSSSTTDPIPAPQACSTPKNNTAEHVQRHSKH